MRRRIWIALASGVAAGLLAHAVAHAQQVDPDIILREPTTNASGAPLYDLAECEVRVYAGAEIVDRIVIPASNVRGGGEHVIDVSRYEGTVRFAAVCRDLAGNESAESAPIDRTFPDVAPGAPALAP